MSPHLLKIFFSVKKVLCILRNLNTWKKLIVHEIKGYLQCRRQNFNVLAFCSLSYVRAAMHRITSLELLGTLIAGLAKKQINRFQAHICWKSSFSVKWSLINESERRLIFMKLKALQCRRQFNVYFCFCSLSYVRAAMHRITSLELLGTLIAGLEQKKQIK